MDLIFFLGVFREKYFTFYIMPNLIDIYIHKVQVRREREKKEILYYPKNERRHSFSQSSLDKEYRAQDK